MQTSQVPDSSQKQVLVCPLNWGLGHATRCTPVIRELVKQGYQVTLAADGAAKAFLSSEFPGMKLLELPGFSPVYPDGRGMVWQMLHSVPSFLKGIRNEKKLLDNLISQYHFDIIISDNRYGIWNSKAYNIIIIHQLMIKAPFWLKWTEPILRMINCKLMKNFDSIWVPDYEGEKTLSGDLSHRYKTPSGVSYIGPLSRFSYYTNTDQPRKKNEVLAIISGPEPQRSIFAELLEKQLVGINSPATLILGKPGEGSPVKKKRNLTVYSHMDSNSLFQKIKESMLVISRPGYSTIMDLAFTGGKVLFVPTPGQTEQEYLGKKFTSEGIALAVRQDKLNLESDILLALHYEGFKCRKENEILHEAIQQLKEKCYSS